MGTDIGRRGVIAGGAAMASALAAGVVRAGPVEPSTAAVKVARIATDGVLAPTPLMGWNSWNSFATTITEAQAIENARIMADRLLPFGYDVFTVDIQWYEPNASSYEYAAAPMPTLDGYGRLIPAPNRFPSSAGGKGFGPLADRIHAMGLKFGIHLMRGIPRLAVERNLPILGTRYRAADIADRHNICDWNPDMWGVDMRKPGAQAYYDSVFRLYADNGVDFVKMDDMTRPYDAHILEIEAAHQAIEKAGRPMLLSFSPGDTPVDRAEHVMARAQMWRISDDFWDEWPLLKAQFVRLANWAPYRRRGGWPDADMLPLGRLALGARDSKFTPDEQRIVMTLWSIARSPLIMGGDLRHLDAPTLALLTNREVLAVNQASSNNGPHYMADGTAVWSARPEGSDDRYVAMFNIDDKPREPWIDLAQLGLEGPCRVRDLWEGRNLAPVRDRLSMPLRPHSCVLYRLSNHA